MKLCGLKIALCLFVIIVRVIKLILSRRKLCPRHGFEFLSLGIQPETPRRHQHARFSLALREILGCRFQCRFRSVKIVLCLLRFWRKQISRIRNLVQLLSFLLVRVILVERELLVFGRDVLLGDVGLNIESACALRSGPRICGLGQCRLLFDALRLGLLLRGLGTDIGNLREPSVLRLLRLFRCGAVAFLHGLVVASAPLHLRGVVGKS